MQVNRYIALPKSSFFSSKLFFIIRVALFIAVLVYLWQAALNNAAFINDMTSIRLQGSIEQSLFFLSAILLLPFNWVLEGKKWQLLARNRISFSKAMEGVLLGVTLDNVLPFGTGGISGRMMSIHKVYRSQALSGILAGQVIQSIITMGFGLFGLYLVVSGSAGLELFNTSYSLGMLVLGLVMIAAVVIWKKQLLQFLAPLKSYPLKSWLLILIFSATRYLIFLGQFLFLGLFFASDIEVYLILGCATWVFAARTFMPKVTNIERLGIRAVAVILFANVLSIPSAGLLVTVGVLWFINLALPSIIGLYYLPRLKREDVF
jgi:hypothetical protein